MSPSDWDDIIPKNWCLSHSLLFSFLALFSLCFDSLLLFSPKVLAGRVSSSPCHLRFLQSKSTVAPNPFHQVASRSFLFEQVSTSHPVLFCWFDWFVSRFIISFFFPSSDFFFFSFLFSLSVWSPLSWLQSDPLFSP